MEGQAWPSPSHCPPKGAAGRSPPLGQLKAGSPEGGWAGGPDLPRGHRGVCAWVTGGVWEGGIYRLLFTKTRPRKTFNSSQLKGDSCGTLTAPPSTHTGLCPPHPTPAHPRRGLPPPPMASASFCQVFQELHFISETSAPDVSPLTNQARRPGSPDSAMPLALGGCRGIGLGGSGHLPCILPRAWGCEPLGGEMPKGLLRAFATRVLEGNLQTGLVGERSAGSTS